MSDANPTDAEQTTKQRLTDADWNRYGKIGLGSVLGLIANSVILLTIVGGDALGIADGVAFLAPVVVLAGIIHDQYNPVADTPFLGAATLFLTTALANTVTLSVRVFRTSAQSEPGMTVLILGVLALMFTPGPALGVWAVRRWWL